MKSASLWVSRRLAMLFASGVGIAALALAGVGYRAVTEWQRSARLLADRRAAVAADLLVTALTRDMRGLQTLVLASADRDELASGRPSDTLHRVASAFARYPYPEAFFSWRTGVAPLDTRFYRRLDRPLSWQLAPVPSTPFSVVTFKHPHLAARLMGRIAEDAAWGRSFSAFDLELGGTTHQVVAVLTYSAGLRSSAPSVFGFTVDLDWVRHHYFQTVTAEVERMGGANGTQLSILDERSRHMSGVAAADSGTTAARRSFPLVFFDPLLLSVNPPPDLSRLSWTAVASAANDAELGLVNRGAHRTLGVAALSGLVLAFGLVFTVQAARMNARLVEMRSDLVSAVTHELKTPLAGLRIVTETLAFGRTQSPEMTREYGLMAVQETKRLARLIDNLLAYSRVTDVTEAYAFEPVAVADLVHKAMQEFRSRLEAGQFDVRIDVPTTLPPVRGDRTALELLFDNLLDNAIRYSTDRRRLRVTAHAGSGTVVIDVADDGSGIPDTELPHVTRKFFRGSHTPSGGSGLGLAIAERITRDHGATLTIRSTVDVGTVVSVTLPVAQT